MLFGHLSEEGIILCLSCISINSPLFSVAQAFEDLMTMYFSHPSVEGIILCVSLLILHYFL